MKKIFVRVLLVIVAVVITVFSFSSATHAAETKPIRLLFGFIEPPTGPVSVVMKEWSEELEQKTQGRVKVELSFGGALGKPGEFFTLTKQGVVDAAGCIPAFGDPGQFPISEMFELPFNTRSGEVISKAMVQFVKKGHLDKEFSQVKLLTAFGAPGDIFFTKEKPIKTLDDMKGMKIWNSNPGKVELLKRLGAIPVALPPTETYTALQKNIVDGAFLSYFFLAVYKVSEQVNYSIKGMPAGTVLVTTIMNKKTWSKLPTDIQEIIDGMQDRYSPRYGASFDNVNNFGKKLFLEKGAVESEWDPQELAKVNERITPLWERWIEEKEKKGIPARKAVDDFYRMLKDVGIENPALGYTPK